MQKNRDKGSVYSIKLAIKGCVVIFSGSLERLHLALGSQSSLSH